MTLRRDHIIEVPKHGSHCPEVPSASSGAHATGIKRAVLVGINYERAKPPHQLRGPHREVWATRNFLIHKRGFDKKNVVVLMDDSTSLSASPTQANIEYHLKNLVVPDVEGAEYVFAFCGHAKQLPEAPGINKEEDGLDEYIIPSDAMGEDGEVDDSKLIKDDLIRECLVDTMTPKSQLLAIFGTCHSNTLMDLEHYRCNRVTPLGKIVHRSGHRVVRIGSRLIGENRARRIASKARNLHDMVRMRINPQYRPRFCVGSCERHNLDWSKQGRVICISACKDSQKSFEDPNGVSILKMIVDELNKNINPSLSELMRSIEERTLELRQKALKARKRSLGNSKKFATNPQLSSQSPLNMDELLFLKPPNNCR